MNLYKITMNDSEEWHVVADTLLNAVLLAQDQFTGEADNVTLVEPDVLIQKAQ